MSEQFKTSPEHQENLNTINISDALSQLEKKFTEKYKISLEGLQFLQELLTKKSSLELTELKSDIESSHLNDLDKKNLSQIPDYSIENFIKEVLSYRKWVSHSLDNLNNEVVWKESHDFISSQKPKWISNARFARACNPIKPHHHIDGCIVWMIQTLNTWVKVTWELILDLAKWLTIHPYQLLRWKAKLPDYNI